MLKLIITFMLLVIGFSANAAPVVIVNKTLAEPVTKYRVKQLYLAQKQTLKSGLLMEVLLPTEDGVRITFIKDVLQTNERRLQRQHNKAVFSGESNIPIKKTSQEILNLVQQKTNVIGVVDESMVNDSVKVIAM